MVYNYKSWDIVSRSILFRGNGLYLTPHTRLSGAHGDGFVFETWFSDYRRDPD